MVIEDDSVVKILLATDNHLGYLEKDPIRGRDSFLVFEEIMRKAQELEVDMILLGGDLFHENKPSRKTLYETMEIFREYCHGNRPSYLEFLSDPALNFSEKFKNANYLDANLNISIPVFTIHGNHDDPTGDSNLSSMDLLSVTGLVNFFGKVKDVDEISVHPILLQKGETKLALYGLGSIRDERLNRSFQRGKVKFFRPAEAPDSWFNMLLFHQNRTVHGLNNYIPESFLDDFLHFILWGHEHESIIEPQLNPQKNFVVCQAGSSVATSLSEGEAKPKNIALLEIQGLNYKFTPIPLKAVRPFFIRDVRLADFPNRALKDIKKLNDFLSEVVDQLLVDQSETIQRMAEHCPALSKPLVRIRVDYSGGYPTLNPQRFGQAFVDRVANPKDMLLFLRKRIPQPSSQKGAKAMPQLDSNTVVVEDLISSFLGAQRLSILPENELSEAVKYYVDKEEKDAIVACIDKAIGFIRSNVKYSNVQDELSIRIEKSKHDREFEFERKTGKGVSSNSSPKPSMHSMSNLAVAVSSDSEDDTGLRLAPFTKGDSRFKSDREPDLSSHIARGTRKRAASLLADSDDNCVASEL